MKLNMGNLDRRVRILIALIIAILYYLEVISGTLGLVLLVLGAVLLTTAFFRFCPLYFPFGISTKKKAEE